MRAVPQLITARLVVGDVVGETVDHLGARQFGDALRHRIDASHRSPTTIFFSSVGSGQGPLPNRRDPYE